MFDAKAENEDAVEAIAALFAMRRRGDTVTHKEIVRRTGLSIGPDYYRLVMRARRRHRGRTGVWTEAVNGVGYMLQDAQRSLTEEQKRRYRQARGRLRIAEHAASSLPDSELTPNQRRLKEAAAAATRELRKSLAYREAREVEVERKIRVDGIRRPEFVQQATA